MSKQEICNNCGQKIIFEIYKKHFIKKLKKQGLPSLAKFLAKLLFMTKKKI